MTFKYQFWGGHYNRQTMDEAEARERADGNNPCMAFLRERGILTHREELDNQPTYVGYCGPMWDGLRYVVDGRPRYDFELTEEQRQAATEVYAVIRYESPEVYESMSN